MPIASINTNRISEPVTLEKTLNKLTGKKVSVTLTDNTKTMISLKRSPSVIQLRVNRIFLDAGDDIIDEIAAFVSNKGVKTPLIRNYVNVNSHKLKKASARSIQTTTRGRYYELESIYARVNKRYFNDSVDAAITWSKGNRRRNVKSRRLGSYSSVNNLIRINDILDKASIPEYVIDFIIYHEMLHASLKDAIGRKRIHTGDFKRLEALHEHFEAAQNFLKKTL